MLAHNRLKQSQTLSVGRCWPSNGRRVQVRAAAAPQDSQTSRRFMALTSLDDEDSLAPHVNVCVEDELYRKVYLAGLDSSDDMMLYDTIPAGGLYGLLGPLSEEDAMKKPEVISSATVQTPDGASSTFLSLEGSQAAVDRLVSSKVIKAAVEVFPTCLVEPQQDEGSSNGALPQEEEQAHATWGVRAVKAMDNRLTGEGVKVALLDTGLDKDYLKHPAFEGVTITAKNFTTSDKDATHDVRGHGTHCLGTILGRPVNGMHIGVAPGITDVIIGKVIPDDGKGDSSMLVEAILWAWYHQGANIINISLAYDLPAKEQQLIKGGANQLEASDEVMQIYEKHKSFYQKLVGVLELGGILNRTPPLIIAACGNGNTANVRTHVQLPAAADGIISVAAIKRTDQGYKAATFSKLGASICAPGVDVLSAAAGGAAAGVLLRPDSGTSMAAPHVAGVAALWWQQLRDEFGEGTAEAVRDKLLGGASKAGFAQGVPKLVLTRAVGKGLVQAPLV